MKWTKWSDAKENIHNSIANVWVIKLHLHKLHFIWKQHVKHCCFSVDANTNKFCNSLLKPQPANTIVPWSAFNQLYLISMLRLIFSQIKCEYVTSSYSWSRPLYNYFPRGWFVRKSYWNVLAAKKIDTQSYSI